MQYMSLMFHTLLPRAWCVPCALTHAACVQLVACAGDVSFLAGMRVLPSLTGLLSYVSALWMILLCSCHAAYYMCGGNCKEYEWVCCGICGMCCACRVLGPHLPGFLLCHNACWHVIAAPSAALHFARTCWVCAVPADCLARTCLVRSCCHTCNNAS